MVITDDNSNKKPIDITTWKIYDIPQAVYFSNKVYMTIEERDDQVVVLNIYKDYEDTLPVLSYIVDISRIT